MVIAGCWTFGLVMDTLVSPALGFPRRGVSTVIAIAGIALSAAMFAYLHSSAHRSETKTTMGLVFMVLNALGIALMNASALGAAMLNIPMVSWTAVLILIFATISPTSPRRMLVASLVAATMDPLVALDCATFAACRRRRPYMAVLHYLPNYISAFIAMVPFKVMQGLGKRLHEAQDLGSYQLVERLGQGGMGEVWRAEHRLLARNAAIKLVRPEVLGGGGPEDAQVIRRRFEREAQATAALSSPHTIRVFDFGVTDDGTFYYVMELLTGRDLESLVREFGPVPADRVVYLLRQVCHSLAEAHARGLVHRDIKPANIYVCRMGLEYDFVKVLDFGLVKVRQRARAADADGDHGAHDRHAGLHGAGDHPRRGERRSARRRVRARLRGVLSAHRPARVRGRHADEDADAARAGRARSPVAADRAADSARARRTGARLPGEGPEPAAAERRGAVLDGLAVQHVRDLESAFARDPGGKRICLSSAAR